jgi:uncharacterized iron-regulated membrane protein
MGLKLSRHAFTRLWDVHAWAGVLGGLVLHVMFLCGGIALFREPLTAWEEPLARGAAPAYALQTAAATAVHALGAAPDELWLYPPLGGRGAPRVSYADPAGGDWKMAWIDAAAGRVVVERGRVAAFLYQLHFLWHDVTGQGLYYAAGALAVLMLVAIVTGVLIHLKDLLRQLHQFRAERARRVMWSDMHKVLGVMGLPFQLAYAYTGAFIVLAPLLLRVFVGPVFGGDVARAEAATRGAAVEAAESPGLEAAVPGLPIDALVERARAASPGLEVTAVALRHHGRVNAVVDVVGHGAGVPRSDASVRVRAFDGAVLRVSALAGEDAARAARRWIEGVHFARFGGAGARLVLLGLALASCATILSGNWVWLARRERRRAGRGHRLLARLTTGVGAGTFVAVAALFLSAGILPLGWPARGAAQEVTFLAALAACVAWALAARDARPLWSRQLAVAAGLFGGASLFAGSGLVGAGPRLPSVVGVDIALAVAALSCAWVAWALRGAGEAAPVAALVAATEARDA